MIDNTSVFSLENTKGNPPASTENLLPSLQVSKPPASDSLTTTLLEYLQTAISTFTIPKYKEEAVDLHLNMMTGFPQIHPLLNDN